MTKQQSVEESVPEGPYIIRTGFYFDDERTGKRFAVLTCSDDQSGGSWLEKETAIGRSPTCRSVFLDYQRERGIAHKKTHPLISFREAVEWGVLDVPEGFVTIGHDHLLGTLAVRIA